MTPWYHAQVAIRGAWIAAIGVLFLIVAGAAIVQTARLEGFKVWPFAMTGWIETATTREAERDAARMAHAKTKTEYREAQADAARQEADRIDRVRQQQKEVTNAIESDYRRQLADLGARAERLRKQLRTRTGAGGASTGEPSPPLREPANRTDRAPGDHRLPPTGGEPAYTEPFGRTPEEQLERDIIATGQALQLDALIDWVIAQTAIDPNAPAD
ncbi:hypothetical protein AAG604_10590 [Citromicrobium bathyomarinum]